MLLFTGTALLTSQHFFNVLHLLPSLLNLLNQNDLPCGNTRSVKWANEKKIKLWTLCSQCITENLYHPPNAKWSRHLALTVIVMNDLKVFNRSLRDSAVEVQNVGLSVIIPHRCFVVKLNHTLCVLVLPPGQQWLMLLKWTASKHLQKQPFQIYDQF